jgi:NAD(P)-dependent dehydrogenase (short-subunit alcohol dehydrogenase family)
MRFAWHVPRVYSVDSTVALAADPLGGQFGREGANLTTTLITGANKGLGYRTAQRLIAAGHDVWLTARDPESGRQAASELNARFVQLDVTDDNSVAAAALVVAGGGLDVLINNAGISDRTPVADTGASDVQRLLDTNVLGPVRMLRAFTPLLDASSSPAVVNVSSSVGSLEMAHDEHGPFAGLNLLGYPASKAALNMLTIQWAKAHPRWRVNSADPGFTATDLNQFRGTQTIEEGTEAIVRLATAGPDGPTGGFFGREGEVPW